jgi:hypothetical protein
MTPAFDAETSLYPSSWLGYTLAIAAVPDTN